MMLGMPGTDEEYDPFDRRAEYKRMFAWWPHRCWIRGQWLWLTHMIQGEAIWFGPGTPVFEYRYYSEAEYLLQKLKGTE
jgi:hypothetical protein